MKLEDQVVSLELAKRLKELSVKQESLFKWGANIRGEWSLNSPTRDRTSFCSAFTVQELEWMMPFTIKLNEFKGYKFPRPRTFYLQSNCGYTKNRYEGHIAYHFYEYADHDVDELHPFECLVGPDFADSNKANAFAQMLIWLIENNKMEGIAMT